MASPTTFQRDALSQHFLFDERPDVQTVETLARGLDMTSKEVEDWCVSLVSTFSDDG